MIFGEILEDSPIIPAVKSERELEQALKGDYQVIFVLFGNLLNLEDIACRIKAAHKIGIIHLDLVEGLVNKEIAVQYIKEKTCFEGIISTKPQLIKVAKGLGLVTIQRIFILDRLSLDNAKGHIVEGCDAIELLPGLLFKVIKELREVTQKPIIVGGLISEKEEIVEALGKGATSISTSSTKLWAI